MLSCSSQHLSFSRSGALLLLLLPPPPRLLLLRRGFLLRAWTTFAVLKKRRYCRASFEPLLCCLLSTFLFRIPDAHCLGSLAGITYICIYIQLHLWWLYPTPNLWGVLPWLYTYNSPQRSYLPIYFRGQRSGTCPAA